ncbi:MAG: tRNA(adenine34) deaminase [Saprospiraceae bacterium]|jgi:tRNA(adenine34) deaminase
MELYSDEYFMKQALKEAKEALENDEIPIGAIVVAQNRIIGKGHNQVEQLSDTTAHAEMIAITSAMSYLGSKYLKDCTLFVTLEPCTMCAGALYWSQLARVVYGAEDSKRGFMRYGKSVLHPKSKLEYGILSEECGQLLTDYFKRKRER